MWVHSDGVARDVESDFKEALFPGAACLIRDVFEEYEAYEAKSVFSVDLINQASLAQRAIFAGEAFLMLFDPACVIPPRAMHEAFATEFLMHTLSHIACEIEDEVFELRKDMYRVIDTHFSHNLYSWNCDDLEEWQEAFAWIAEILVGNQDFEYGSMLGRLDDLGASFIGKLFADLNQKNDLYFEAHESKHIEANMTQIVQKCAKIIDFIEKYQKSGNFRAHP
jgi:hypothetical protein